MFLLGFDIGSSSVKASLVNAESGKCVASAFYPKSEAPITAVQAGWAEQDPAMWWTNLKLATADVMNALKYRPRYAIYLTVSLSLRAETIEFTFHSEFSP